MKDLFNFFSGTIMPDVDVIDKGNEYVVDVEIPGVKKEDIKVDFENSQLRISVSYQSKEKQPESQNEKEVKEKPSKYLCKERSRWFYSNAERVITFPDVDENSIKAAYKDGVLTVILGKNAKQTKEITIS